MDGAGNIEYHQRTRNRDPPLSSLKPQPTELIGHPCVQQGDHWNCSRKFYPSYPWVLEWSLTLTFSPWYWKVIFFVHSPILTSVGLTVYSLTQAQATRQILTLTFDLGLMTLKSNRARPLTMRIMCTKFDNVGSNGSFSLSRRQNSGRTSPSQKILCM